MSYFSCPKGHDFSLLNSLALTLSLLQSDEIFVCRIHSTHFLSLSLLFSSLRAFPVFKIQGRLCAFFCLSGFQNSGQIMCIFFRALSAVFFEYFLSKFSRVKSLVVAI